MNLGSGLGSSLMLPLVDELPLLTVLGDLSDGDAASGRRFIWPIKWRFI